MLKVPLSSVVGEPQPLLAKFFQRGGEVRQPLAFLLQHGRRHLGHKGLVGEFGLDLDQLALEAGDLLADARLLGGNVHFHVQADFRFPHHGDRREPTGPGSVA